MLMAVLAAPVGCLEAGEPEGVVSSDGQATDATAAIDTVYCREASAADSAYFFRDEPTRIVSASYRLVCQADPEPATRYLGKVSDTEISFSPPLFAHEPDVEIFLPAGLERRELVDARLGEPATDHDGAGTMPYSTCLCPMTTCDCHSHWWAPWWDHCECYVTGYFYCESTWWAGELGCW
jgi:hypothetical protein